MLFASFDFLVFFAATFAGYWALANRPWWRAVWVLGASYFFYMAGPRPVEGPLPAPWYFVGLLVLSTAVNYLCGLLIAAAQRSANGADAPLAADAADPEPRPLAGRAWLMLSLLTNLGLLGYFKYTGFLLDVASDLSARLGATERLPALELLLPVGISFYTFQGIGYTIDVYRRRAPVERSPLKFAVFMAFFPQLVAGPIMRAGELLPQLSLRPRLTKEDVDFALFRVTKGLVKKVVLGDFIAAAFVDGVFASPLEHSSLENLLALYGFTLQIYADFSGYSDIAIGAARLLGVRIPENFDRPYQAIDVADFWRRWHITLSTWLRDYVYYPLGGSRLGFARTCVNLWVTMFLVGIWHGASWNFVVYAVLQASAMVYSRLCSRREGSRLARAARLLGASLGVALLATLLAAAVLRLAQPWSVGGAAFALALLVGLLPGVEAWPSLRPVHVLLTVHFAVLSRIFFRADDLESARAMLSQLAAWDGLGVRDGLFRIQPLANWLSGVPSLLWARPLAEWGVLALLAAGFAAHYVPARWIQAGTLRVMARSPAVLTGAALALLFGVLSLLLVGPRANIYFVF